MRCNRCYYCMFGYCSKFDTEVYTSHYSGVKFTMMDADYSFSEWSDKQLIDFTEKYPIVSTLAKSIVDYFKSKGFISKKQRMALIYHAMNNCWKSDGCCS